MGIAVRARDGGVYFFVPVDSDDGPRLLDALFTRRPALRDVPRPMGGAFVAHEHWMDADQSPTGNQATTVPTPSVPTSEERVLAVLAHVSVILLPIVLPVILYLASRRAAP